MPDALPTALAAALIPAWALLAGAVLGAIYFGGLWWTVRRAGSFRRPASSMLASVLLRMTVALGGFYLVAGNSWQRLLLCLLGFVVARAVVSRQVCPATQKATTRIRHAP